MMRVVYLSARCPRTGCAIDPLSLHHRLPLLGSRIIKMYCIHFVCAHFRAPLWQWRLSGIVITALVSGMMEVADVQ